MSKYYEIIPGQKQLTVQEGVAIPEENDTAEVKIYNIFRIYPSLSGFGGLGVACWPLVPKFAGSNPAEAVGFLGVKKSSARLPSEGK